MDVGGATDRVRLVDDIARDYSGKNVQVGIKAYGLQ